ncbi:MAG: porin family protein [Devosiaceae bacterium]|nr:porin family protein [Devosiaceae bacterium MH13]
MGKTSTSLFIGALATTLLAGPALAADYTPPPVIDFEPEYDVQIGGNLYLRGYIGFTNQEVDELDNELFAAAAQVEFLSSEFESGGYFGGAIGYRLNEWFRADVSAEWRMRTGYYGLDRVASTVVGTFDGTNQYEANKEEWLFMANAFVDLGTYYKITPYIGAGIGAVHTTISSFSDTNVPNNGVAYAADNSEWSLAWALHAGLAYQVTDHVSIEMGYRYLDLGDASSGDIITFTGANTITNPMEFNGLTSHDVQVGMRWELPAFGHHDDFMSY